MPGRDPKQEREIMDWMEAVLGEPLPKGDYDEILKDGVVLCKLMNKISPNAIPKFKEKGPAFMLMENVGAFQVILEPEDRHKSTYYKLLFGQFFFLPLLQKAVKTYGVPDEEIFQTPDLFEGKNIPQVTVCLYALGRTTQKHPDYSGPQIGPKMSQENRRNFSQEQIRQGRDAHLSLQAGTNKGASQAGLGGMGNTRHM